jgi:hypothetical protein
MKPEDCVLGSWFCPNCDYPNDNENGACHRCGHENESDAPEDAP